MLKRKAAPAILAFAQNVRASDVRRHQIRCELDPAKPKIERISQSTNELRLPKSRYAFQERMPAGEDADQNVADYVGLADNDLADLVFNPLNVASKVVSPQIGCRRNHRAVPFQMRRRTLSRTSAKSEVLQRDHDDREQKHEQNATERNRGNGDYGRARFFRGPSDASELLLTSTWSF